jgi:ADP-ribose diphosphatase
MEKIIKRKTIFKGRKFEVQQIDVELEPGKIAKWEVVYKGGNSVAIVPIDENNNVYLVREYFGATDERTLCLPKGMVDKGEEPIKAAQREMQEEIGFRGDLQHLVDMSVSPGYLTQKTGLFLATNLKPSKLQGDEIQYIEPVKIPLSKALEMVRDGQITEARTIGGLALAKIMLDQK